MQLLQLGKESARRIVTIRPAAENAIVHPHSPN